jgi:predicted permease
MLLVLNTVGPVFAVIGLGYWLAGRRALDLPTLSNLAILVTSPALMFSVLSGSELVAAQWAALAGGTVFVAAGAAGVGVAYLRLAGEGRVGLLLPAIFANAGNMLLPSARLAFGPEGLEAAAIVFVTAALLTSTFGIWIAKGENGFAEVLKLPLLYGSIGGLALALSDTVLPRLVMEPIEMLADMAIPILLLSLGAQLRNLPIAELRHSVAAVVIRMGGGVAFAALFVALFDVQGLDRQVLLLSAGMPPAVINVVFAERYGRDPGLVASSIVIGTLVSVITIPVLLLAIT